VNNKAKVRRSTKLLVLGKAKVISYKDLEEARVKAKEKGKRGRKRKSPTLEEDILEPKAKVARISKVLKLNTLVAWII
jgi:hypothetical protein